MYDGGVHALATERRGRRLQALWVGFVVCGVLLTQLGVRFGVQANVVKLLYVVLVLAALPLGFVCYRRDIADDLLKAEAPVPALPILPGIFRIMLIALAVGLFAGVWQIRNEPLLILILPLNAMFIWVAYIGDVTALARRRDRSEEQSAHP